MQPLLKITTASFACLLSLVGNIATAQSEVSYSPSTRTFRSTAVDLTSPDFERVRQDAARQAAAVAGSAANSPKVFNSELVNSREVSDLAAGSQSANKAIERRVGKEEMKLAQLSLPSLSGLPGLDQFASDLKNGKFVSVSEKGPEIIVLIRSLGARQEKDRAVVLKRLQAYSSQGYPEALNFVGIVFEYGLFQTPRDLSRAVEFYKAAARHRYQPAIFNLATIAYFGKAGPANSAEAEKLLALAMSVGPEGSSRVCGLASFLHFRQGDRADALKDGRECRSALSNLPNAAFAPQFNPLERIKMLREAIAAGADDGFPLLETTARSIPNDKDFLYCKYALINRIRFAAVPPNLRDLARDCYLRVSADPAAAGTKARAEMATMGIAGFVSSEAGALLHLRRTNRFHHSWSVPYLPFGQSEVDLFQPIMSKGKM